jgi:V/A-type H+-transporting ATPase subunit E
MSIESLVDKILDDTRKTAAEIERKVLEEVRDREEAAGKEIQRITEGAREKAERSMAERKQRMLSMAELEGRKTVLTVKQELIEEAFGRAIDKVLSLDPEAYGAFVIDLILQADPVGDEEVFFNQKDRDRLGDGWIKRLNRQLIENKKKGEMRIAGETRSIRGGAILKRGRKEVNCSIESVILSKRNKMEAKIASVLFGDS